MKTKDHVIDTIRKTMEVIIVRPNAHAITIDRPMVLIPIEEYKELLNEAGLGPTPELDKEITRARANFKKGKVIKWEKLKDELH